MENKVSNKKVAAWKKTLTRDQKVILNKVVQDENQKIFQTEIACLDSALSSVLIKTLDNISLKDIKNISNQISVEMMEEKELTKKIKNKFLNDEEGYVDYMKELERDVVEFVKEGFKNGLNQKRVREETIIKFPKLSKSQITNAVKRVKEGLTSLEKINKANEKVEEKVEEKKSEIIVNNKVDNDMRVENTYNQQNKDIKKKLKIKKIDIEGEFANYECSNNEIELNINKTKLNRSLWEEFKLEVEEVFRMVE